MNRIISAVMMVLALIMTTAAASAEAQSRPSISVSADYYGGALNIVADIENDTSEQVVGTMYFSVYYGDKLEAVKTVKNTVADTGMSSIEESIDIAEPAEGQSYTVKAFMWSETMESVCSPGETLYTYSEAPAENAVQFMAGLFCNYSDNEITVYESVEVYDTVAYRMSGDWKLIVNGVEVDNELIYECFNGSPERQTVLNDMDADGLYDELHIDYYTTAVVDRVEEDEAAINIYFIEDPYSEYDPASITLDKSSQNYSLKNADGEKILPADIMECNVLTIKYDISGSLEASSFYDITVSDKTVSGVVTEQGVDDFGRIYYIFEGDSKEYAVADGIWANVNVSLGMNCTACLSVSGEIAYAEQDLSALDFCILDRVYYTASGNVEVRIICEDGVKRTYELGPYSNADPEGKAAALLDVNDMTWYDRNGSAGMEDYSDGLTLEERVVTYTVNSSNEIRLMDPEGAEISYLDYLEYDPDTSMLGEYEIGADTCILDLCDWWADGSSDVYTVVKDNLAPYTVYGTVAVTGSRMFPSPFVAITSGYGGFSANSRLAVVSGVSSVYDGGAVRTKLEVIENFEEKELLCADTSFWYLETGDAIIYKFDSDGYIDYVCEVTDIDLRRDRYEYLSAVVEGNAINRDLPTIMYNGSEVEYILAPVIDRDLDSITVGKVAYGSDVGDKALTAGKNAYYVNRTLTYPYSDELCAYALYNNDKRPNYAVSTIAPPSVAKSEIGEPSDDTSAYLDTAGQYINLGMEGEEVQPNRIHFALLRIHNGTVLDVYSIKMGEDDMTSYFMYPDIYDESLEMSEEDIFID